MELSLAAPARKSPARPGIGQRAPAPMVPTRSPAGPGARQRVALSTGLPQLMMQAESTYQYPHKTLIWIEADPALNTQLLKAELESWCQKADVLKSGDGVFRNGKHHQVFNPPFTHRVHLTSPELPALVHLARYKSSVTYVEAAFDCIMPNDELVQQLQAMFDLHFVQSHQGKRNRQSWDNGGTSTGSRRSHYFTWYCDQPSRYTGEYPCFHFENRIHSAKLKTIGIKTANELAAFNFGAYWHQKFNMYQVDLERLGRHHRNQLNNTRDRYSNGRGLYKSRDWHMGKALWLQQACDNTGVLSVQTFISNYGHGPYLTAFSVPLHANSSVK